MTIRKITLLLLILLFLLPTVNAFSIDELTIQVQANGDAKVTAKYSLTWWESILIWFYGIFGKKGEKLKSYIENALGREICDFNMNGDTVTFTVKDYVGKSGSWYWTKLYLTDETCKRINLKKVYVVFPDGFIYEFNGCLPNIWHLDDQKLAKSYVEAKALKLTYENVWILYSADYYWNSTWDEIYSFASSVGKTIGESIVSSILLSPLGKYTLILDIKGIADTLNDTKTWRMPAVRTASLTVVGTLNLDENFKEMYKLKEREVDLIYNIVSNPKDNQKEISKLIDNLKKQKVVLSYIEEKNKDWSVVIDSAYSASMDEGVKDYLTHLQNIAIKLHEIDARHVNDLLSHMNAS